MAHSKEEKNKRLMQILSDKIKHQMKVNDDLGLIAETVKDLACIYFEESMEKECLDTVEKYSDYVVSKFGEDSIENLRAMSTLAIAYYELGKIDLFDSLEERIEILAKKISSGSNIECLIQSIEYPACEFSDEIKEESSFDEINRLKFLSVVEKFVSSCELLDDSYTALDFLEALIAKWPEETILDKAIKGRLYKDLALCDELEQDFYAYLDHIAKALDLLKDSIGIYSKTYGRYFLDYLHAFDATEQFDKAYDNASAMLSLYESKCGKDDAYCSQLRTEMAISLLLMEKFDESFELANDNYKINVDSFGENSKLATIAEKELADLYFTYGESEKAAKHFENVKTKAKSFFDVGSDFYNNVVSKLAESYTELGEGEKALNESLGLIDNLEGNGETNNEKILKAHYLLGLSYRDIGKYKEAMKELKEVLKRQLEFFDDKEDRNVLETQLAIATVYDKLEQEAKAQELFRKVAKLAFRNFGPESAIFLDALERIASDEENPFSLIEDDF